MHSAIIFSCTLYSNGIDFDRKSILCIRLGCNVVEDCTEWIRWRIP